MSGLRIMLDNAEAYVTAATAMKGLTRDELLRFISNIKKRLQGYALVSLEHLRMVEKTTVPHADHCGVFYHHPEEEEGYIAPCDCGADEKWAWLADKIKEAEE